MSAVKIMENEEKKLKVAAEIDCVIIAVCNRIKNSECSPELYAEEVKALATLVTARALL